MYQATLAILMDNTLCFLVQSAWTRLENPDFILDSSTEDSGSSAGEFSEGDILDSNKSKKHGKVVKEGFLLKRVSTLRFVLILYINGQVTLSLQFVFHKQGHLRKKWKARKIVLKDNPAVLEYYAASKVRNFQRFVIIQLCNFQMHVYLIKTQSS